MVTNSPEAASDPRLFLDTNIILDILWARETGDDSAELVERIRNCGWQAVTSTFAIMEVTSQEQEERFVEDQRREGIPFRNIYRQLGSRVTDSNRLRRIHRRTERLLRLRLPFLEYLWIEENGWPEALRLCGETDIDPSDCINLAVARLNGALVFVTKDGALIRRIESQLPDYIEVARPDRVDPALREFGIDI